MANKKWKLLFVIAAIVIVAAVLIIAVRLEREKSTGQDKMLKVLCKNRTEHLTDSKKVAAMENALPKQEALFISGIVPLKGTEPTGLKLIYTCTADYESIDINKLVYNAVLLSASIKDMRYCNYEITGAGATTFFYYTREEMEQLFGNLYECSENPKKLDQLIQRINTYTDGLKSSQQQCEITTKGEVLTIDDIITFSHKVALTFKDFSIYKYYNYSGEDISSPNCIIHYEVKYNGEEYELQASFTGIDTIVDYVTLVRKATHERYDIRNGKVEEFLNTHKNMWDYLTYKLPNSLIDGSYNATIGGNGGNIFINKTGKQPGKIEHAPIEWYSAGAVQVVSNLGTFENGKLVNFGSPWNHTSYEDGKERLEGCETQAWLVLAEHDLYTSADIGKAEAAGKPIPTEQRTSRMWYVFFVKEDSDLSYAISLNADLFTKEDIIDLARTVHFKSGAFSVH